MHPRRRIHLQVKAECRAYTCSETIYSLGHAVSVHKTSVNVDILKFSCNYWPCLAAVVFTYGVQMAEMLVTPLHKCKEAFFNLLDKKNLSGAGGGVSVCLSVCLCVSLSLCLSLSLCVSHYTHAHTLGSSEQ